MKNKYLKISWQRYEREYIRLAKKLKGIKITRLVAISRGGLVGARILSDALSIPISHITIESYKDLKQEKKPVITELPSRLFHNETILIVDDVADSGKTFKKAIGYFNRFTGVKIYTLAMFIKPRTEFIPDFYAGRTNRWIIFPYEKQETVNTFFKMFKTKQRVLQELKIIGLKI